MTISFVGIARILKDKEHVSFHFVRSKPDEFSCRAEYNSTYSRDESLSFCGCIGIAMI